ncbi:hypothetical protein A6770_25350 [Nostoc minutum NIES-26]|uniref:Uncharacterized protein n=1 Tax=Nostoc minutum NIES-26 TaxID=1844469 RepID=A0A367QVC3_9NOSO|nr:hypothetical protein A6770_25350 [Nostoc minutum NIES-26]
MRLLTSPKDLLIIVSSRKIFGHKPVVTAPVELYLFQGDSANIYLIEVTQFGSSSNRLIGAGESFLPLCNKKYSKTRGDCGCVNCLLVIIGITGKSGDSALLLPRMYLILTHSLAELHGFQQQHHKSFDLRFFA